MWLRFQRQSEDYLGSRGGWRTLPSVVRAGGFVVRILLCIGEAWMR